MLDLPTNEPPSQPSIEVKLLPSGLSYDFLNANKETHLIFRDKLTKDETAKLLAVLEKHRPVLGYSIQNLKGISSTLCTHGILKDPNCSPSREPQQSLNNMMREVVKKEVLKLLHAMIIYTMPFSEWVSPVQVVPKKEDMIIIENAKNELIPQRTITGWRLRSPKTKRSN